ncbi:MAG: peptidoglycan DD-metalloendopeptidase family protein [Balneolaceae bacterium]
MKVSFLHIVLSVCLAFVVLAPTHGQTYEEKRQEIINKQTNTRAEINVLDARIKSYQQRIDETEIKYNKSFKQYESLNTLISLQDDKIKTLEEAKSQIEAEIELTQNEIDKREDELKILIDNYKKILLYTYKNGRSSDLELLLTSDSFNQMIVRSFYLKKFEEFKAKQAKQIRQRKTELDQARISLRQSLNKNVVLLEEIREEKQILNGQRTEQKQTVETIKSQRSDLLAELKKNREQKEALEGAFNALINEEELIRKAEDERLEKLAAARKIADEGLRNTEVARYSKPTVVKRAVSDDMLNTFATSFATKKGTLAWPVNSRTISKKFGKTRNPIYGTETEHLGVNIVAEPRSAVQVVSDGYVFVVSPISGFGDVVFVNHGGYYTAYGNLSQIDVSKNQILKAGDRIGLSGVTNSPLGENLFFMVRKDKTNLNPQDWLSR